MSYEIHVYFGPRGALSWHDRWISRRLTDLAATASKWWRPKLADAARFPSEKGMSEGH